ncbi:MAG: hypothetical protein JO111_01075 [Caulobacteraceae bacterium]|nr:hypothetical protein [Caulobacteraceae bacterium]
MQGYITLATGSRTYFEMALNLALSLSVNDPNRPRCLLTDRPQNLPRAFHRHFDVIRDIKDRPGSYGCPNKLQVQALSPFKESMFIDADCIVAKPDMDRHWAKLAGRPIGISAEKKTAGTWHGIEIADVISELGIDYVGVMNSGVFCFGANSASAAFFDTALKLVTSHWTLLGSVHRQNRLADEPFIGAALGLHRIEPVKYAPEEGSVMVTTYRASDTACDPFLGRSELVKRGDFAVLGRLWPRSSVQHSPSVVHFVRLRPRAAYQSISDRLRAYFSIERFDF